jgi:MFS family permease
MVSDKDRTRMEQVAEPGTTTETSTTEGDYDVRTVAIAVTAGVFLGGVATGVAFPTLPLLDSILGISAVLLGVILAANRIARLLMNAPAGGIIDRFGPRKPMIIGLFVQGIAPFGYVVGVYTPPIELAVLPVVGGVSAPGLVFVLARALWGVGSAFVFVGAFAVITHVTEATDRGRWTGYMRAGQSLGFPAGLVIGGVLTDIFDVETAFLTAGVLAMFAGVIGLLVLPDVSATGTTRTPLRRLPSLFSSTAGVLPIGVANGVVRLLFGGVLLTTAVKYAVVLGLTVETLGMGAAGVTGLVMGAGVLAASGATVITGRISDRLNRRELATLPAFGVLAVGFGVLAVVPTLLGMLGGVILVGLGVGGTGPVLLAALGDRAPSGSEGKFGGMYNIFGDVGLSVGPLVAFPAVTTIGYEMTYQLCAVVAIICLVLVNATLLSKS